MSLQHGEAFCVSIQRSVSHLTDMSVTVSCISETRTETSCVESANRDNNNDDDNDEGEVSSYS